MLHHDRCMINIHKKIHQKIKRNKKTYHSTFSDCFQSFNTKATLFFFNIFTWISRQKSVDIHWNDGKISQGCFIMQRRALSKKKKLNKRKKLWNFFAIKNIPSRSTLILIFVVIRNQKYWLCHVLKYRFIFLRI